jgi:hypothetical protein
MENNIKNLDIRDVSIIDALPVYGWDKKILTIGAGKGRIEWYLYNMGYNVVATDIKRSVSWDDKDKLIFIESSILDPSIDSRSVVICSEVLEHIHSYRKAFKNLLSLTDIRLIITIPRETSFYSPDHVNFWNDQNLQEFVNMSIPYMCSISRIRTKKKDIKTDQWCYLIIIDKRQCYG